MMNTALREAVLRLLPRVQAPAQYVGGELNSVAKDRRQVRGRLCLCFPDAYSLGTSHHGLQVLYSIASIFIVSIGLAVAFGMMRVINFAHGEFLMLGGFAMIFAVRWGVYPGVEAEGLLLVPEGEIRADIVAVPDCSSSPEAFAGLAPCTDDHLHCYTTVFTDDQRSLQYELVHPRAPRTVARI